MRPKPPTPAPPRPGKFRHRLLELELEAEDAEINLKNEDWLDPVKCDYCGGWKLETRKCENCGSN